MSEIDVINECDLSKYDYNSCSLYPVVRENPITAIAKRSPWDARLALQYSADTSIELAVISQKTSISSHHRDIVCSWLANRQEGERNMDISFGQDGWFGRRCSTRVRIW